MQPFKRVMLAAPLMPSGIEHTNENILREMQKLRFPVLATLKIDGVRAFRASLKSGPTLLSRTNKLIPNVSIRERSLKLPSGFDMELYHPDLSFDEIESIVMSREHERQDMIQFHMLDWYISALSYQKRLFVALLWHHSNRSSDIVYPSTHLCFSPQALLAFFLKCEAAEGEGICFRTLDSPYIQKNTKDNRSTLKEQYLVKLSRFVYEEGTVVGFVEQRDEQGNAKGTLGALVVQVGDTTVEVGSGWKRLKGHEIWMNRGKFIGCQLTFKSKPCGRKNKPRHPIYVGFREKGY